MLGIRLTTKNDLYVGFEPAWEYDIILSESNPEDEYLKIFS